MTYDIQPNHPHLGRQFLYTAEGASSPFDGEDAATGTCEVVEIQPANFVDVHTGKKTASRKIRLRLKHLSGKAFWTDWMPYRGDDPQAAEELEKPCSESESQ